VAARTHKTSLTDSWKAKIQASMLVNRLQNHVLGKVEMGNSQVRAADILLKKVAPDLAAVSTLGKDGKPVDPVAAQPIINVSVGALAAKKGNGHG
jgi:hypothetical protein